ncbi:MAG: chemotaxis protein CheB [Cyclobacteriaceae bacterium]
MVESKIKYEILVIGGSAGSIEVVMQIIPQLPRKFPLAVVVVLHRKPMNVDLLLGLLQNKSHIWIKIAENNDPILPGLVYLAPSDYHLRVDKKRTIILDHNEKIKHSRPSIDVAMQSVGDVYKEKSIGIVLTGANEDGASGLKAIMDSGGSVIIQEPLTAQAPTMPLAARHTTNGKTMEVPEIINFLLQLSNG